MKVHMRPRVEPLPAAFASGPKPGVWRVVDAQEGFSERVGDKLRDRRQKNRQVLSIPNFQHSLTPI